MDELIEKRDAQLPVLERNMAWLGGLRADLALVDDGAAWPVVRAAFRAA